MEGCEQFSYEHLATELLVTHNKVFGGGDLMEKDWVRWLVCILIFLCGGIFFKLVPDNSFKFILSWEAFSAIGTLSAVGVSLYLACSTDRKRQAEDSTRSSLVAARLAPIAEALEGDLEDLLSWVYFDDLDSLEPISDIRERVKRLRIYLDRMPMQDIERIIPIGASTANYLSRAVGEVEGLIVSVERESKEWSAISQSSKVFYRTHWGDAIVSARDFLIIALPKLVSVAKKAAPTPEWGEIFEKEEAGDC